MSSYEIRIGGTTLSEPSDAAAKSKPVIEVTVHQDIAAPSMFAVRLPNWDDSEGKVTWSDKDLIEPASEVEILLPGLNGLVSVMEGEITGLEPEFRGGGPMTVTVRGYDRSHRLMRGTKTRSFPQKKDSDIAVDVVSDHDLVAYADNMGAPLDYVMQHNQTDLEFLHARAKRLGFEVMAEGKELKLREHHENDISSVVTLNRKENLEEFYPRLSTIGLVGEVVVHGWSAKHKEMITAKASAGDLTGMGPKRGDKNPIAAAGETFKGAQVIIVDQPVQSEEEANKIALGRLREMALTYITGEGVAIGCADLRAGTVVNIQECGNRFSGLYYLTSVRHTYSSSGYRTSFTVQRNAS